MSSARLYEIRGDATPVSPTVLLDHGAGRPRGFWAAGDRWVAHTGILGRVSVRHGAPDVARSRFGSVQEESRRLFSRVLPVGGRLDGPTNGRPRASVDCRPRIFGGFAFSPRRKADPVWSSFPPALFHLPEVELEHRPADGLCSLVVRGRTPDDAERNWRRWSELLERAAASGHGVVRGVAGAPPGGDSVAGFRGLAPSAPPARVFGTDRATWGRMVWQALGKIGAGDAEKIVLARTLEVAPAQSLEPADLVIALWEENHGSYVFLFEPEPGEAIVGAAPETIATLVNGVAKATAVAGSVRVGADSVETAQLAQDLLDSAKDRAEQDFVVRDVVARLRRLGCRVQRDVEPHVLALARIQHLETKIAAEVPPGISLLNILASLHPNPAVCGIPREVARSVLTRSEDFDRGWYAGPVGFFDSEGKGIFVPALRSAVRRGEHWRLFAGAGIVAGSDPALEWEETELKFRPVLSAIARAGATESTAVGTG